MQEEDLSKVKRTAPECNESEPFNVVQILIFEKRRKRSTYYYYEYIVRVPYHRTKLYFIYPNIQLEENGLMKNARFFLVL